MDYGLRFIEDNFRLADDPPATTKWQFRDRADYRQVARASLCGSRPRNPPVSTLTGGAIPTLNSRPVDDVETTSGETVSDSEFSD